MKCRLHLSMILPLCVVLAAWQAYVQGVPERLFLFGSPAGIFAVAVQDMPRPDLWLDVGVTLSAVLIGLALGTIGGTGAGLGLALHAVPRRISRPYLAFLASVQIFTIAPLLIIWFGIGWWAKVAMATIATFFLAMHQAIHGIEALEGRYRAYAQSLDSPRRATIRHILLPGMMRWVLSGMKANVGFAALGVLVGEYISAEHGLGHYIFKASGVYDIARAWFGIILLAALTGGLAGLIGYAARRLYPQRAA